ncbi:uncharacterized protein LOC133204464 [Saccostrea echinata]|uniref:uncharacterized protein LOC133204464 n=1 Tax=Saccostrea echinata TaxID=191078 RepID=UPI002A7FEF7F|nr:uncharacterized protein LOC133204464 [Saccostrea echinata]
MTRPSGSVGGFTRPSMPGITRPSGSVGGFTRPSMPGMTRPSGSVGGFTRPSMPGITRPSGSVGGFTRPSMPGMTRPSGSVGGFTRPSLPGGMTRPSMGTGIGGFTLPPKPKIDFRCPKECPVCQKLKNPLSKPCTAVDEFGDIKADFENRLTSKRKDILQEIKDLGTFKANMDSRTCSGMIKHIDLYGKMDRNTRDKLKNFMQDPSSVSSDDMKKFPKEVFSSLNDQNGTFVFQNMDARQKVVLCKDVRYMDCMTRTMITKKINCARALVDGGKSISKQDAKSMMDVRSCQTWDREKWNLTLQNFPEILKADCLKAAPTDLLMDNMDVMSGKCGDFSKRDIQVFANITSEKIKEKKTRGQMQQKEKDDWVKLLSKCGADPSFFKDVLDPKETLRTADLSKASRAEKIKFVEDALKTVRPSEFSKDEIANAVGALANDRKVLRQMNASAIEGAACDVCSRAGDIDKSDLRKFSEVVMEQPSFRDPSAFDQSTIACMGCMMPYMKKSSFDNIPDSALRSALTSGNVKEMKMTSKKMGKKVLENALTAFNKPNGRFSDADLKKMKGALGCFEPADIDKIPDASFTADVLTDFESAFSADDRPKKSLKMKLVDKVKKQSGGIAKLVANGLGKELSTADLEDAPISSFPDLTGDNGESTIKCNKKQARVYMKKVKSVLGDINGTDSNFTLRRLANMKPFLSGLEDKDMKNIEQDGTFSDKIHTIAKAPEMSREQLKTLTDLYKTYSKIDSTDEATFSSSIDSNTVDNMAPEILAKLSKAELKKFGTSNCDAIVQRLAEADDKRLTKDEIKEKFEFIKECKGKTTGTLTSDDLSEAGNMLGGISSSDADRMDADALEKMGPSLQKCNLESATRKKIATNMISKMSMTDTSQITSSGFMVLGNFATELTDSQLASMDKETVNDATDKIMESFKENEDKRKERKKNAVSKESESTEEESFKAGKKKMVKFIVGVKESLGGQQASGRRKRSATPLTCTDLTAIGTSGLSALSTTQISNIQDQDFKDCAELLGSVTDWSEAQKEALVAVAKRSTVWNTPSTWTTTNVYSAGSFIGGLTTAEIDTLSINLDAISRMGTFSDWTDSKKQAVFSRWLAYEKSSNPATITSSELRSLGHMTCGASTGHIATILSSVYKASADTVGEVTSCSEFQLQSWIAHAKTEYGTYTQWDSATITSVGIVMGGLTASEISSLTETQIDSISAFDMSHIPSTAFAGFTTTQIYTFEPAQAQAVTASQRAALSSSQLSALSSVSGISYSNTAAGIQCSLFMAILLASLAQFINKA